MLKTIYIVAVVAALVFLLSLAAISYLSPPPASQPSEQQSSAQTEHEQQTVKPHSIQGFLRFLFPDGTAVFTFWLVIATIVLGIIAVIQIGYLERAETITNKSAKAAEDAAKATRDAVILSDKTGERQLRAYIAMDAGSIMFDQATETASAYVTFKNYGVTPAYKFRAWMTLATAMATDLPPFENAGESASETLIGPTASIDQTVSDRISSEAMRQITAGERRIYLYGRIDYQDAFGKHRWLIWKRTMQGKTGMVAFKELRGPGWGLVPDPSGDEAN